MTASLRALAMLMVTASCVTMRDTETRTVLDARPGERTAGVAGKDGPAYGALVDDAGLLLSFAAGTTRCLREKIVTERVRVLRLHEPALPRWRLGGSAWIATAAAGLAGVAGGVWLGTRDDALFFPGAPLLLFGLGSLALVPPAQVVAMSSSAQSDPVEQVRPVETYESRCEADPLVTTPVRLRLQERRVTLATDRAGQVRLTLRHAAVLGLVAGTWSVESYASARALGTVEVPILPAPPGKSCASPRFVRVDPATIDVSAVGGVAVEILGRAREQLDRFAVPRCVVVDPTAPVVVTGSARLVGEVAVVEVVLVERASSRALPRGTASLYSTTAPSEVAAALGRAVDLALAAAGADR